MKRLVILALMTLFCAACWPLTPAEMDARNKTVGQAFRCMWTGDCSDTH